MKTDQSTEVAASAGETWDTSSHQDFYAYYEKQSLSPKTLERFRATTEVLLRLYGNDLSGKTLDVLDVGCGAGSQAKFWLDAGHRYWGIDINRPLIELARERSRREGLAAQFEVGSATSLPYADSTMDVCVLPELLEHVKDWQGCVNEAVRVLRPHGLIYINTSSRLCPVQQEFNLPMYGWYPSRLKQYFERRAVTDWPAVANFAKYPAVNWFTFYQLRDYLGTLGFSSWDRFDIIQTAGRSPVQRLLLTLTRGVAPLRLLAHMLTPYTLVVARKAA